MDSETIDVLELQLEVRNLRQSVFAMREQLQQAQAERGAAVVHALSEANAENGQLRATIAALREELEKAHAGREDAIAAAQSK